MSKEDIYRINRAAEALAGPAQSAERLKLSQAIYDSGEGRAIPEFATTWALPGEDRRGCRCALANGETGGHVCPTQIPATGDRARTLARLTLAPARTAVMEDEVLRLTEEYADLGVDDLELSAGETALAAGMHGPSAFADAADHYSRMMSEMGLESATPLRVSNYHGRPGSGKRVTSAQRAHHGELERDGDQTRHSPGRAASPILASPGASMRPTSAAWRRSPRATLTCSAASRAMAASASGRVVSPGVATAPATASRACAGWADIDGEHAISVNIG